MGSDTGRLRQEGGKFMPSLGDLARLYLQKLKIKELGMFRPVPLSYTDS